MSWLPFRRVAAGEKIEDSATAEALDRLLSHYVIEVSDATVDEICRNLAALPANRAAPSNRGNPAKASRLRQAPLFWPGLGVAFGMLLLGIVIGNAGLPVPLSATDVQPEFSDLLMPQGT